MAWPLVHCRLYDWNCWPVEAWEGWMVPVTLDLHQNVNHRLSYVLEIGHPDDMARITLTCGPLYDVVWEALQSYARKHEAPACSPRS